MAYNFLSEIFVVENVAGDLTSELLIALCAKHAAMTDDWNLFSDSDWSEDELDESMIIDKTVDMSLNSSAEDVFHNRDISLASVGNSEKTNALVCNSQPAKNLLNR